MILDAPWVAHPGTQSIFAMLTEAGHQAFFVGGCVRNGLLDTPVDDIDLTTDATPDQVLALAKDHDLRAIPTGIDHGTVTLIAGGKPHEITTFRRDIATDGRRATVAFSTRIEDDAARRDFTMNALYADRHGTVQDPTGQGLVDLRNRRLRFIGDPAARIAEDYLRILRFFRFHAWYADPNGGLDPDGLAACAAGLDGIATLSKERIGAEMLKLLAAPDPGPAIAAMAVSGVLGQVLVGADPRLLWPLISFEQAEGTAPDPIRRLASLGGTEIPAALRLSKSQATRLATLRDGMGAASTPAELGYRNGAEVARDILLLRAAVFETPPSPADHTAALRGAQAKFPIRAVDLQPGVQGPALGQRLTALETAWIASDFTLTKAELLALP